METSVFNTHLLLNINATRAEAVCGETFSDNNGLGIFITLTLSDRARFVSHFDHFTLLASSAWIPSTLQHKRKRDATHSATTQLSVTSAHLFHPRPLVLPELLDHSLHLFIQYPRDTEIWTPGCTLYSKQDLRVIVELPLLK